jgi:hypothetical protein
MTIPKQRQMYLNLKRVIAVILISLLACTTLPAQDTLSDASNSPPASAENSSATADPEPEESTEVLALPLSRLELQLSLCVLGFGVLLILIEVYLISRKNISGEDTIKFVTITIIIISTLFLITAGYSNDQIAPAVGLLGTIAGYLLGRINSSNNN